MTAKYIESHTLYESNLYFLPFMYLIPEELITRFPTLRKVPRRIREVVKDEDLVALIESDQFLNEIMDAAALMIFPHLGFGKKYPHYTGYSLVYFVANQTRFWSQVLDVYADLNLFALYRIPEDEDVPFVEKDFAEEIMEQVVEWGFFEQPLLQELLDVMRKFLCDEDIEPIVTNARRDFWRRWYHSRSKYAKQVPLYEYPTGKRDFHYINIPKTSYEMSEITESEDFCQTFKATLSNKDRQVLQLREDGYTFEEIAVMLDYKTHSGVVKRMQAIKSAFCEYNS